MRLVIDPMLWHNQHAYQHANPRSYLRIKDTFIGLGILSWKAETQRNLGVTEDNQLNTRSQWDAVAKRDNRKFGYVNRGVGRYHHLCVALVKQLLEYVLLHQQLQNMLKTWRAFREQLQE